MEERAQSILLIMIFCTLRDPAYVGTNCIVGCSKATLSLTVVVQLTVVIKGQNVFSANDFHEDAVVVEVHPDRQRSEGSELNLQLVVQTLLVIHVDQVFRTCLEHEMTHKITRGRKITSITEWNRAPFSLPLERTTSKYN